MFGRFVRSWCKRPSGKTLFLGLTVILPCLLWIIMARQVLLDAAPSNDQSKESPLISVPTLGRGSKRSEDPCLEQMTRHLKSRQRLEKLAASDDCPKVHTWIPDLYKERKGRYLVIVMANPISMWQLEHWIGYSWLDVGIIVDPIVNPDVHISKRAISLAKWIFNDSTSKKNLNFSGKESKWTAIGRALQMRVWRSYEFVWMPDAQVRMNPTQVRRMFEIASANHVRIGYPARGRILQVESDFHREEELQSVDLNNSQPVMHFEERVNLEAPFLRGDVLQVVRQYFQSSPMLITLCAMEIIWPIFLGEKGPNVAVIDSTKYSSLLDVDAKPWFRIKCLDVAQTRTEPIMLGDYFEHQRNALGSLGWCHKEEDATSSKQVAFLGDESKQATLIMDPTITPSWLSTAALEKVRWKTLIFLYLGSTSNQLQTMENIQNWAGYQTFDLVVICDENTQNCDAAKSYADIYLVDEPDLGLSKFERVRWGLNRVAGWKNEYEYVWIPDDDISMTALEVQNLVNGATRFNLRLAHPAYAGPLIGQKVTSGKGLPSTSHHKSTSAGKMDSYTFDGRATVDRVHVDHAVRIVSRVPMIAPLIRVDALAYIVSTLRGHGEYLSSLWPQLIRDVPVGVVDIAPYRQTGAGTSEVVATIEHSRAVPSWVKGFGCPITIPVKQFKSYTKFQFHATIRQNADVDWCVGLGFSRWIRDSTNPQNNYSNPMHSIGWEKEVLQEMLIDPTLPPLWFGTQRLAPLVGHNLVIVVAGDDSLHTRWNDNPNFDLCVVYFGSDPEIFRRYKASATYAFQKKDMKWQLVRHALNNVPWRDYEYVWLPDDDVDMDPASVDRMFRLAHLYDLRLGQPAIYDFGVHYMDHVVRGSWAVHFINFVEIMAPFLRVDALEYLFPLWNVDHVYSGYGLDTIWPQLLRMTNIGVVDAAPFNHTGGRIIGGKNNTFYNRLKVDAGTEERRTVHPYDCKMLWNVTKISNYVTVAAHNRNHPDMKLTKQIIVPSRVNRRIKQITAFNLANKYREAQNQQVLPKKFTIVRPLKPKLGA